MAYTQFDYTKPDATADNGTAFCTNTRKNLLALRDACIMGAMAGWNMSKSGGTASQPAQILYSKGTERLKVALTWNGSGNPSQIVYSYSSNSGSTYDTIGTETITYDGDQNVSSTTWS